MFLIKFLCFNKEFKFMRLIGIYTGLIKNLFLICNIFFIIKDFFFQIKHKREALKMTNFKIFNINLLNITGFVVSYYDL